MRNGTRLVVTALLATASSLSIDGLCGIDYWDGRVARAAESLIVNGNFEKWSGGVPEGWSVEIGATPA